MARKSRKQQRDAAPNGDCGRGTGVDLYRGAAYLRLSCDDTKKRGDSLETQRNIIENYAAATPGIRITETYTDKDTTGTNFERPGFRRMLADAQSGRINCIIVKDFSRFGRSAIDGGYYLEQVLPSLGVRFIAVTDEYDSNQPENEMLLPLMNIINEAYALDISQKCRAVHQQNIADGRYVGRLAPYGYRKSPDDCRKLIPDEETAPVVRQIFEWFSSGDSRYEIAHRLSASGIPTPAQHNHAKGYNKQVTQNLYWQPNTVRSILLDRVYIGDMVQGKSKTVNGKQRNLAPDEWICVPNTHKAIVSRDIFERVGHMADEIRTRASEIKKTQYTPNLFLGKVLCAHCNRPMRRKRQNKDGTYWYRCDSQDKHGKNACTVVSVKEAEITSAVMDYLRRQTTQVLGKYVTLEKTVTVPDDAADAELREINRALNNAGRFLKSLYENMVSDIITPDEYGQMKCDYEAKIEALSDRADEIRRQHRKAKTDRDNHYQYADAVSAAVCDFALTPEIADSVIQKIVVHKDKTFEVFYRFDDKIKEVG